MNPIVRCIIVINKNQLCRNAVFGPMYVVQLLHKIEFNLKILKNYIVEKIKELNKIENH